MSSQTPLTEGDKSTNTAMDTSDDLAPKSDNSAPKKDDKKKKAAKLAPKKKQTKKQVIKVKSLKKAGSKKTDKTSNGTQSHEERSDLIQKLASDKNASKNSKKSDKSSKSKKSNSISDVKVQLRSGKISSKGMRQLFAGCLDSPENFEGFIRTATAELNVKQEKTMFVLKLFFGWGFKFQINGDTPLYLAVSQQNWKAVKAILEAIPKILNETPKYQKKKLTFNQFKNHLGQTLIKMNIDNEALKNYCEMFKVDFNAKCMFEEYDYTPLNDVLNADTKSNLYAYIPVHQLLPRLQMLIDYGVKVKFSNLKYFLMNEKAFSSTKYTPELYQECLKVLLKHSDKSVSKFGLVEECLGLSLIPNIELLSGSEESDIYIV